MNRYVNKRTVGGILLAILLLLIFFSRTIYTFYLPVVTATKPFTGRLTKSQSATGLAEYSDTVNVYSSLSGWVSEVLAEVGQTVAEGDPLFAMRFDRDTAERQLKELSGSRARIAGDIESIRMSIENTNRNLEKMEISRQSMELRRANTERAIEHLNEEVYEADTASRYELDMLDIDIAKAQSDLENTQVLYELDEVSLRELNQAQSAVDTLLLRRGNIEKNLLEQDMKSLKAVEDKEKNRQKQLLDYQSDLESIDLDLRSLDIDLEIRRSDLQQSQLNLSAKQIELSNLALSEEVYNKALRDIDENLVITAPRGGVVSSVEPSAGEYVGENRLMGSVGVSDRFLVTCEIPLDNDFVAVGDTCKLSNSTHNLDGYITKIEPQVQNKKVIIMLDNYTGSMGETFDITFKKESASTAVLVPNGAINQDNDGYYVNLIDRRDGMLGKEYYLRRLDVIIGDSDDSNTVILQGIMFYEPIALISDKAISTGEVISIKNESDFFE